MENLKSAFPILGFTLFLLSSSGSVAQAPHQPPVPSCESEDAVLSGNCLPLKIGINSADTAALEVLTGVGPSLAKAIVAYRKAHGPFRAMEELQRVKGIGSSLLQKNRHMLSLD